MFGNNKDNVTSGQLDEALKPLTERLDQLETALRKQARQMASLEQQLKELQAQRSQAPSVARQVDDAAGAQSVAAAAPKVSHDEHYYLSAPTPDGSFLEESLQVVVGKSVYELHTRDGKNGRFAMLTSADAIATAMISVSQFVKPVCRIEGNTHRLPQHIETIEEGVAQREEGVWKVVRKATVKFS